MTHGAAHKYEFTFALDIGKAIPEIGSLFERVNHNLSRAGFDERLACEDHGLKLTVQSPKPLTEGDQQMIAGAALAALKERLPRYDFRCASIRRKSGESRSQPRRNAE